MGYEKPMTGAERVAKRRAALRAQGLRPKTFWVPDRDDPKLQRLAAESCARINRFMADGDDWAFIDAVRYRPPDE